ncbi:toxin VasX [Xenorhabdus sp. PB30.3]|uniref:toxin VasX n=1 Tax=Xenorhabdus sp. PB30.3 TaxID=2788941 RepID=UPI001E327803|nr:toxin VasX [Xenorhabdus sp. PB30.3]MCC8380911.1 hypothetical protein [Xenorhabdus sp. PB30.3]
MTSVISNISANANESVSRLDMGSAKYPCDGNIKPLYPVRYAYVNFFGEEMEQPESPPDIHTLMSATTLKQSKGYAARLMRSGWIYIREEDSMEHRPSRTAYFHIFRYEVEKSSDNDDAPRIERFRKYMYRNKKDARDGVMPEPGLQGEGYPFLFVAKDVSNISIAYSEHLWHPDVIARMNRDKKLREKTMQFINLDADNQQYAIEATESNFTKLIEDYKTRKEQFSAVKAKIDAHKFEELDINDLRIDELTTEKSYEMDAENIAAEIRNKLCYQEKARIVILHDPIGRQKEILEAHNILDLLQQYNAERNLYPMTIGLYIDDYIKVFNKNNPIAKRANSEVLSRKAVRKYWPKIRDSHLEFEKRQDVFISLFKAFASAPAVTGKVGSLDNYFQHFFSIHEKKEISNESDIQEIYTFVELVFDIFHGLQMSVTSEKMLEELISLAAGKPTTLKDFADTTLGILPYGLYDPNKEAKAKRDAITAAEKNYTPQYSTNAWEIAATGMVKILTHGESKEIAKKIHQGTKNAINKTLENINDPNKPIQQSKKFLNDQIIKISVYVSEKFLELFGKIVGKAFAIMEAGAIAIKGPLTHLSDTAIQLIVNKFVPVLMQPFGIVIDYREGLHITPEEFNKIQGRLEKIANKKSYSGNKGPRMPKHNETFKKLKNSQSLFYEKLQEISAPSQAEQQFENTVRQTGEYAKKTGIKIGNTVSKQVIEVSDQTGIGIKLAKITIKEGFNTSFDFLKVGTHKTAILLEKVAPGFSLFFNVQTATSIVIQSQFSSNNPLDQDELSRSYDVVKFSAALISLTADLTLITSKVTKHAHKFMPNASPVLLNRLEGISNNLSNKLNAKWVKSGLGLVNIMGAYVSFIDGRKARAISNKGAAYSNYAIGLGSAALGTVSIGMAAGIEAVAIGSALMAGMAFMGWVLVIGGTIGLLLFNSSDTQNLFRNSFWGNGDMYPFWGNAERPAFHDQLKDARKMSNSKEIQHAFDIESQEFLNLFFMPNLNIQSKQEYKKFSTIYTFKLPAFQQGSSDLQYAFYKPLPKPVNTWHSGGMAPVDAIRVHMESFKKEQEYYNELKSRAEEIDGKLYIYDEELTARFREALKIAQVEYKNGNLELTISVEDRYPYPNKDTAELFWHYIPYEDTIVPLRYLTSKEMNQKPIIGFKGMEFR